jgi:plasmid stabilization system protein ParE
MTFKVIAEAEAKQDWNEAFDWYEEHEAGVGLRFDDAIRTFLQTLSEHPERFPFATHMTRKAKLPAPRPYSVYFVANTEFREVKVLAIWHGARSPADLRRRLK